MTEAGTDWGVAHIVAVSQATNEALDAYAQYRHQCELLREQILDRVEELTPWLADARVKVKAEIASREGNPHRALPFFSLRL